MTYFQLLSNGEQALHNTPSGVVLVSLPVLHDTFPLILVTRHFVYKD